MKFGNDRPNHPAFSSGREADLLRPVTAHHQHHGLILKSQPGSRSIAALWPAGAATARNAPSEVLSHKAAAKDYAREVLQVEVRLNDYTPGQIRT
jgi:hypothetical protein